MALDFGILQPVNISGQIAAGQQDTQRNQLAQQQLAMGGLQQQKTELELADYKNRQAGLDKFIQLSAQNGKTGSPEELAASFHDFALSQRDPHLILTAQQMLQAASERKAYMAERQPPAAANNATSNFDLGQPNEPVLSPNMPGQAVSMPVRPTTPANQLAPAPTLAAAAAPTNQLAAAPTNQLAAAPTNQLAAAPTNQLANPADIQNRIIDLQNKYPSGAAKTEIAVLTKQLEEANKPHVLGNSLVTGSGQVITSVTPPTNLSKLQAEMAALPIGDPRRQQYANMIQKETQNAPTQLAQLIKERDALPAGDPNRKLYDTAINKTQTEIEIQKAHLNLAQSRYAQDYAQNSFKPDTIDMMANLLIQTGNLPPLGMGKKAADARAQIMNRASEISTGGGTTAAGAASNLASNKAEYAGTTSGSRAIGTQIANVQVAANETNKMIGVAKPYVDKVDPSDYPAVNAVGNYVAKNTGDPNIVGLATSLNAIVNTYARAINPKGVATVSDKNHARDILNAAMSKGQLNEAFNVMQQEMGASLASGPETKAGMRSGSAPATPAPAGNVVDFGSLK
jgi:hypothetical protein